MADYIHFWLAKAYVEILLGLGVLGLMVVAIIVVWIVQSLKSK